MAASSIPLVATSPAAAADYRVGLTASATDVPPGTPVVLTAQSNVDVRQTSSYIRIYDTTAGVEVAICNAGTLCSTVVQHTTATARTYAAYVAGYGSGYPPVGVLATSPSVTVRWSVVVSTSVVAGAVGFTAAAYLPRFPCPPPPPFGTGPCYGTLSGTSHGHLAGTVGLDEFEVTWEGASGGTLGASFSYSEWACDGTENVLGSAFGSGTAQVSRPSVAGSYRVADETFTRAILGVHATFAFDWLREGVTAAIAFESFEVYVTVDGLGDRRVLTGARLGAAAFAVTGTDGAVAPTCEHPLTNVRGEVAGTVRIT